MTMLTLDRMMRSKRSRTSYDMTIFQTPSYGEDKGYRNVYRLSIEADDHADALYQTFRMFNVSDLMPKDFNGRYLTSRDIVFIDEGRKGHFYYRLQSDGWTQVNRVILK